MADDPIRTAAAAESGLLKDTLLEATIKRTIYVLNVGEAWGDLDQTVGEKRLAILDAAVGYLYLYDATDTTTADDGLTCRVTGTGERYHIEDAASISVSSVLAQQNTPPGSPANNDAYIVGTSPTGAWAAQATNLAIYTRRGWVFAVPEVGMTVYDQATGTNLQFDENGDWADFASDIPDDSVLPVQLAFPAGVSIEAQQNAPPSVPGDPATTYLVGTSGSGAWSGHNNAFAFSRDGATWSFIAAYEVRRSTTRRLISRFGSTAPRGSRPRRGYSTTRSSPHPAPRHGTCRRACLPMPASRSRCGAVAVAAVAASTRPRPVVAAVVVVPMHGGKGSRPN